MWLTRFALTRPVIIAMLFVALTIFGLIAYFSIGRSQNPPNTDFPIVVIQAAYPGASPQDMEKLVIKPIEDQLNGIENLDQLTATAQEGTASLGVQFKLGTDLAIAAIDVQRRIDVARIYMPTDLNPPLVFKGGGQDPLMELAVSSHSLSPMALSDMVTNQIEPLLTEIPGIQTVTMLGAQTREFHVEPDPDRMIGMHATLEDIFNAVAANNANLPGGLLEQPTREATVSVKSGIETPDDIANIPLPVLNMSTKALRIGDVAVATDSYADQRQIAKFNGEPLISLVLSRNIAADEIMTTQRTRAAIKKISAEFPRLTFTETLAPADYTKAELNGVWLSLFEGILLTAIVMMLFLHAWRNAVVVMVAIPTSILATFLVMKFLNFTIDFMSMMALSLIIGILVDDSIVVLENITRHRDMGESPVDAAINGRSEIGGAALAITMVDVVVFLPIAFLPGIVGQYLKEFALVIVVATLFSLFVSFTLTPLLAGVWSVRKREAGIPKWFTALDSVRVSIGLVVFGIALFFIPWQYGKVLGVILTALVLLNWLVQRYEWVVAFYREKALPFALQHGYFVTFVCTLLVVNAFTLLPGGIVGTFLDVGVIVVLALGFVLFRKLYRNRGVVIATFALPAVLAIIMPVLGQIAFDFVPSAQTGFISMTLTYPPGTPILTTSKYVDALSSAIAKINGVQSVYSSVGQKQVAWTTSVGGNYASLTAATYPNRRGDTNEIAGKVRELSYLVPGGDLGVSGADSSGSGAPIFYGIQGPDEDLALASERMVAVLRSTPGSVNVESSEETGAPRLNVDIDRGKAQLLGISPGDAATVARMSVDGAVATKVRTATGLVDVRVEYPKIDHSSVDALRNTRIRAADGTMVPLASIAHFSWSTAPTTISRLNRQRVINVTGSLLPGYSLGAVTGPLVKRLAEPGFLPPGVQIQSQGDTQFMAETLSNMGVALLASFLLVYMLMVVLYGSFLEPLIVMFSVPVAIVGALAGLALMHLINPSGSQSLNLISMIGIIMLFGLVSKNGILLVDYSNTLVRRGLHVRDAVLEAASTRLRPILMTTAAMVFGMLPLALGFAEGSEWRQAMGTVIIGGLISSLILTLFLVPMIYNSWIGASERRQNRRAIREEMRTAPHPEPVV